MKILAIETSCDETGLAVLKAKGGFRNPQFKIEKNLVISQIKIHKKFGGVVPHLAKREHQKNLPVLFEELKEAQLKEAGLLKKKPGFLGVDLIAVVNGPGLSPALWQGVNFAKDLSCQYKIPLVPINHLEAHIFSVFLKQKFNFKFPALTLIVSGGHTQLTLITNWFEYKTIGSTRDDAVGEAFDKVGRILGIDYPAGPEIEKRAKKGNPLTYNFPSPMIKQNNFDFSFAGLKTAVYYQYLKDKKAGIKFSQKVINNYCADFQRAAFEVLKIKTLRAIEKFKVKQFILTGGVSANQTLRRVLKEAIAKRGAKRGSTSYKEVEPLNCLLITPKKEFCTDNGAMVGAAGYFRNLKKKPQICPNIKAAADLRI